MGKYFVILAPLILILVIYSLFNSNPSSKFFNKNLIPTVISDINLKHPYAIDSLMARVNPDNQITIEKQVSDQAQFKTFLISYYSENLKQFALMYVPSSQIPSSGWPVVVVNHGYIPPEQYSTINSYKNTSGYYASQGFLVLKPDYRGHDQSQGDSNILFSRSQYAVDVLNLITAIDTIKEANPNQIFLYGHSMGGEVSLQAAENINNIKGITLWAPAVASYPESFVHFLNKRRPTPTNYQQVQENLQQLIDKFGANQLTSLSYLSQINLPILIHHGTADESVPFIWGQNLVEKLKQENKTVTFYPYSNDNHDIAGNWSTALSRDVNFFRSLLN